MRRNDIWFVTGASKGMGLAITKDLLNAGKKVTATSRNIDELKKAVGIADRNFNPIFLDVTKDQEVKKEIDRAVAFFGGLDVVVNNAGFGQTGALEEISDSEARNLFDVNVFGLLNIIRHAMPHLRIQRNGHIFNCASILSASGAAGWGTYCGTKFAVEGISQSLSQEIKKFNIKATSLKFGFFRTEFLADSLNCARQSIDEYNFLHEDVKGIRMAKSHKQPGNPKRLADVLMKLSVMDRPPVQLFLGSDAYAIAKNSIKFIHDEVEGFKDITFSTDF